MADDSNSSSEAGPLRSTEGIVRGLYHHLWMKNHNGESCGVNIPHTVIRMHGMQVVYQNSVPTAWYFTSLKERKIMRKKRSNMEGPVMAQTFTGGRSPQCEACAWCTGHAATLESTARKTRPGDGSTPADAQELAMEYLTHDRVQAILDPGPHRSPAGDQLYDGILQKFVEPRDTNDFIVRAAWSPTSSAFEKRTNKHRLMDHEVAPLDRRVASFTAPLWLHTCMPLVDDGILHARLDEQCGRVAKHIKDVTRGLTVVARMEVFFKIDTHNRIWLLYCSSLSLENVPPLRVVYDREVHGGGSFVLKDPTQSEEVLAEQEEKDTFVCVVTGKTCPRSDRIQVPYKQLLQHWFAKCRTLATEAERIHAIDAIPPAIRRANPNMSRDYYLHHRSQPFFLISLADICPEAESELSRTADADLAETVGRPLSATLSSSSPDATAAFSRTRPASCSATSRGGGLSGGQPLQQQHWHRRVAGKPAVCAGAVVTPQPTGRAPVAAVGTPPSSAAASTSGAGALLPPAAQARQRQGQGAVTVPAWAASASTAQLFPSALAPKYPHSPTAPATTLQNARPTYVPAGTAGGARASTAPAARAAPAAAPRGSARPGGGLPRGGGGNGTAAPEAFRASNSAGGESGAGLGDTLPSRTSTRSLSGDELRTLKELSDAYADAEQLTANLLKQASQLLRVLSATSSAGGAASTAAPAPAAAAAAPLRPTLSNGSAASAPGSDPRTPALSHAGSARSGGGQLRDSSSPQGAPGGTGAVRPAGPLQLGPPGSAVSPFLQRQASPSTMFRLPAASSPAGGEPSSLPLGGGPARVRGSPYDDPGRVSLDAMLPSASPAAAGAGVGAGVADPSAMALTAEEEELLSEALM